jgi:hypothetical protein
MVERRPLIEGIKTPGSPVDEQREREFIHHSAGFQSAHAFDPNMLMPLSVPLLNDN